MLAPILPKPIMPSCMSADCTPGLGAADHRSSTHQTAERIVAALGTMSGDNFATARREQGRMTTSGVGGHDVVGAVVAVAAERLGAAEASALALFLRDYYARV